MGQHAASDPPQEGYEALHAEVAPTREEYNEAVRTLDVHALGSMGYCLQCGVLGPCPQRAAATEILFQHPGELPTREPGASHPEQRDQKRTGGVSMWVARRSA